MNRRRLVDLVVIETPSELETTVNEYGDEDESLPSYWDAREVRAHVVLTGTGEAEDDRETVTRQFDLFLAPDTEIDASCWVRFSLEEDDELRCRVIGEPMLYRNVRGQASHRVAHVEAVQG